MEHHRNGEWTGRSIVTRYNGVLFRSRLEARWAVFMDQLGVKWFYEYEGFELPSGARYVPDFWLPSVNRWLEIKPANFYPLGKDAESEDARKCYEFMETADQSKGLVILCGSPAEQDDDEDGWYSHESGYVYADYHYLWCRCPGCGAYGIEFDGRGSRACKKNERCQGDDDKCYSSNDPTILAAKATAMAWRFY